VPLEYHENFLRVLERGLSLQELYYTNFIYGSYNKKRVFSLRYEGVGSGDMILVGDSHLISLEHVLRENRQAFENLYINRYHGVTSFGFRPSKKCGTFSHFIKEMSALRGKRVTIFLCIGEVECRNSIGMFSDSDDLSDDEHVLNRSIQNYTEIVEELSSLFNGLLYLINVPTPTYTDQEIWTKKSRPVDEIGSFVASINEAMAILAERMENVRLLDVAALCKPGDGVFYGDHHIAAHPFEIVLKSEGLI